MKFGLRVLISERLFSNYFQPLEVNKESLVYLWGR